MSSDVLADLSARIREHPAYAAAARRYVAEYAEWRHRLGVLNKVVANLARLRVLENLIYLHFLAEDQTASQGATFERLAELSGATDDIGARAVRTLLRLAQTAGLVVTGRNPADGRQRVYLPTDAMLQHSRAFTTISIRPLDAVFPDLKICARLEADPAYHRVVVMGLARVYFEIGLKRVPHPQGFGEMMRLEGAAPIFCVVIDCFRSGRDIPVASEFSRRFFVSQSQARAVLKAAEAAGLITTAARGHLIDAEPLARAYSEAHIRFLAFSALHTFGVAGCSSGKAGALIYTF